MKIFIQLLKRTFATTLIVNATLTCASAEGKVPGGQAIAEVKQAEFLFGGDLAKVLDKAKNSNLPILLKGVGQIVDQAAAKSIVDGQC